MRFSCDKCAAKYTIADERVRGKIVAVKCSKCGTKITVNGKTLVVQEEVVEERTRVASLTDMEALRANLEQQAPAPARSPSPQSPPAAPATGYVADGWHVIIDRQQTGPLTAEEFKAQIAQGKLTARTYVWRDGQGDWKRAGDIPSLAAALSAKSEQTAQPSSPQRPRNGAMAAPKNGASAAEPAKRQSVEEERPTVNRSDLDLASLDALAEAGDWPMQGLLDEMPPVAAGSPAKEETPQQAAKASALGEGSPASEVGLGGASDQDLNSLLFDDAQDIVPTNIGKPIDLASAVAGDLDQRAGAEGEGEKLADPFASVPDNPNLSQPAPIGEQTRFFMRQAGVNRRNPPWKIALVAVLGIGVPVAALYGLSQLNVGFLQVETSAVDDSGQEVSRPVSVFSTEGLSSIRDSLLKKKQPPPPKPKIAKPAQPKQGDQVAADPKKPDEGALVAKPEIKFDTMSPEERQRMAAATKDLGNKAPKVNEALLEGKLTAVDGKQGLEESQITEVFAKNLKAFQGCVENELRRNPYFKGGKVFIIFTIGSSGIVTKASLNRDDIENTDLGTCLKEKAKRMVFPSFSGEAFEVESPLLLAKGG
ncbi:MAG: zinc-ribbon domain-containing protein [Deltaproteobacteria bacterium]|nr:zinc-ribbon domain-containing protein [Deltaproteobacteria bacterium]